MGDGVGVGVAEGVGGGPAHTIMCIVHLIMYDHIMAEFQAQAHAGLPSLPSCYIMVAP